MEISFDRILEAIKRFMKQLGAKGVNGELNKVRDVEQHLQAIDKVIHDPEQKAGDKIQGLEATKGACKSVAYGRYLPTKAVVAAMNKLVIEMNIENLPESLRPKGIEIRGYVGDINSQLQTIESVVKDLAEKLKVFKDKEYRISEVEKKDMEMITLAVDTDLKICGDYQTRAEEALEQFESDVISYEQRQKKAAWAKVGFAVLLGVGAGALAASAVASISACAASVGGGIFMAGATGGLSLCSYTREYKKIKAETENFVSALKLLSTRQKTLKEKNKEAKGKIDLYESK